MFRWEKKIVAIHNATYPMKKKERIFRINDPKETEKKRKGKKELFKLDYKNPRGDQREREND